MGSNSSGSDGSSLKFSNLSEMHKVLSKSMDMLDGIPVPSLPQFNAQECLFDIKFNQLNEEIEKEMEEPLMTPRNGRKCNDNSFSG